MEYARSKDQPWVNLISGMYHEGLIDLPFSFIFAQKGDDRVLIDTGFMQDEHSSRLFTEIRHPDLDFAFDGYWPRSACKSTDAINAVFVTHAHLTTWRSIAEFPNAHIYIQKSELLSW